MTPARLIPNAIAHAAILAATMGLAAPASAEEAHQIGIYGEVAPRCWVGNSVGKTARTVPSPPGGRAICNQARLVLASEMRMIGPDGALMARAPVAAIWTAPSPIAARTALEIVVTPQL